VHKWQPAAGEKAHNVMAASVRKMVRVAHHHLGQFFEDVGRELHWHLIYYIAEKYGGK
jgi:hypothetical protein